MSLVVNPKVREKFNSRKLWIFIVLFVIATVALFMDVADFSKWAEFVKWMFAIYAAGNVMEHGANAIGNGKGVTTNGG